MESEKSVGWLTELLRRALERSQVHQFGPEGWEALPEQELLKLFERAGGAEAAVETLIQGLKNEGRDVRVRAARVLPQMRGLIVEPLIRVMKKGEDSYVSKDKELHVRRLAIEALGEICDARAIEPLTQALEDEYVEVREKASSALAKIIDAQAPPKKIKKLPLPP